MNELDVNLNKWKFYCISMSIIAMVVITTLWSEKTEDLNFKRLQVSVHY